MISTKNGDEVFKIKGFIEEPLNGAYVIGLKQVFISEEDYDRIEASSLNSEEDAELLLIKSVLLHIYQSDNSTLSISKFRKELNNQCGIIDNSFATLNKADSISYTTMLPDIFSGIL